MKTVKLNYIGMGNDFNPKQNLIYDILLNNGYQVEISDEPDYIICGFCDVNNPYSYCSANQVRIMYSGENYIPDFNLIDYAISPYPISFLDRSFYLPACVWPRSHWVEMATKNRGEEQDILSSKPYFANFIASHESERNIRGDFFKKLCAYKRVESPGTYLNNMPDGYTVDWLNDSKTKFQRKCKFTLCFESTKHPGFVTEKIMDAFYADTIPVYYGSDTVTDIFNKDAFINCSDFESFDAAIEKIKELDQDDEKYLEMLRQPILVDPTYPDRLEKELGEFVCHIFDQPVEKAYRRSRVFLPQRVNGYLTRCVDQETLTMKNLICRIGEKAAKKVKK